MNSKADLHNEEHLDLVFLYALQALPPSDIQRVEALLSSCAECQQELMTLRPIVNSFASWPTDVLRPSLPLWGRLAARIAQETGTEPVIPQPEVSFQPQWEEVAPGIQVKILANDEVKHRVSMMVRLDPETEYPGHTHAGNEELHLLDGVLKIDDRTLHPGDFIHSEAGSIDHRVWSETGCTCFLMTSTKDVLF